MTSSSDQVILHASAVALAGQAVLITGASGSGKSSLALTLIAFGGQLVADDRVVVTRAGDHLTATAPDALRGGIEARGVGLLRADSVSDSPVGLMVIMDEMETDRLPPRRSTNLLGIQVNVLHNSGTAVFAAAIVQYLKGGGLAEQWDTWAS